ncbi:Protein diaphanous-like protein 3 isoform X2 [Oopsacas minuta]|uniref:Protein diaphanous-like protein 3 isoform X2 n=1 Tax=Oopsacas minuta TaxID=111878 RepID=A0AAV7KC92_9METZ|nr:Protein diaphanous-like protein 3 isoform X2 [Oopsacas minuta]
MNNRFGLEKMLSVENSLETLYSTIYLNSDQILTETMRLLAPLCFFAHPKVLAALTNKAIKKNQARFDPVIQYMLESDQPLVQAACFLFINSILVPIEDSNFRVHLRCEMVRSGLEGFINEIGPTVPEEIETQLRLYDNLKNDDLDELSSKWNRIQADFTDLNSAFQLLTMITQGSEAEKSLLSIFQHLLLIRDDYYIRPLYFKLIEQCITQIVLQKNGTDPDSLTHRKFELAVDPIIDNMLTKAHVEESRERALKFEQQVKDEQLRFHELEVQTSVLQQKVDELQDVIDRGDIAPPPGDEPGVPHGNTSVNSVKQTTSSSEGNKAVGKKESNPTGLVSVTTSQGKFTIPYPPADLPEIQPNIPNPPPNLPEVAAKLGTSDTATATIQRKGVQIQKQKYDQIPGMSHFFWKKINEQDITRDTIWVGLNEHNLLTKQLEIDLSKKFVKQGATHDLENNKTEKEKPSVAQREQTEPQVITKQAAQNIGIFLRSSRYSSEQIKRMIITMDEALSEQMLVDLLKFLPSSIDIQKLNDLKNKYRFENLNVSERFLLVVTKIDRLELRLRTMIFRQRIKNEIQELVPQLRCIKDTSEKVKNSKRLRKVIEYVLLIGNKMNAGTKHAQTAGFHLESLTKLDGTKTNDHTLNLMNFIVEVIEGVEPDLLKFVLELEEVRMAAKVNDENLRSQIRNMSNCIDEVRQELKHYSDESKIDSYERYHKVMPEFLKETEQEHKSIKKLYKDMESSLHETIRWFAMDPRKVNTEDFFAYFVKFINIFEKARKENELIRETRKKELHKREVEEAAKKKRENMKRREEEELTNSDEHGNNKKGLLDDLLSKIELGELGPKKSGMQKKSGPPHRSSLVLKTKVGPKRQLSSVDEDKLKEPDRTNNPRAFAPVLPPKTNSTQSKIPSNSIPQSSYNNPAPPSHNPPNIPSFNPPYSSNPSSAFSYNSNPSNLHNINPRDSSYYSSQNTPTYQPNPTYSTNVKKSIENPTNPTYIQEQDKYPYKPPPPKHMPDTRIPNPIPTPRVLPSLPSIPAGEQQINHYPYQRNPTKSRVISQPPLAAQFDDINGHDTSLSDKIAIFNKVSNPRKPPSRSQRSEESTFF